MKQEEPDLSAEVQNEPINPEIQNKILLICDFNGNIVFWKGDPKVFQLSPTQYLKKNFLTFDFTLFSRLTLASNLTMDLFKHNQRKEFQLEIIKKSPSKQKIPYEKVQKFTSGRIRQYLLTKIKFLKVSASIISGYFEKLTYLGVQCGLKSFLKSEKDELDEVLKSQSDQRKQTFLLFQVEQKSKRINILNFTFLKNRTAQQIRNKLWDFQLVKRKKIKISQYEEKYEKEEEKNGLRSSIKDLDFDSFFNSKKKLSAFQPNQDAFHRLSEQKGHSKEEWLVTPAKEKLQKIAKSSILRKPIKK